MQKMRCKECDFCNSPHRMNSQRGFLGRKVYYCENPDAKKLPLKAFGNKAPRFIGFGEHKDIESKLTVKTAPRWCPLNNKQEEKS